MVDETTIPKPRASRPGRKKVAKKKTAKRLVPRRKNPDVVLAGPKEGIIATKGKLQHDGRWVVLSPIRYQSTKTGEPTDAGVIELDAYGDAVLDDEGKPLPNIIGDIAFSVAQDLRERGVLKPFLS
jgi:hypothetical protein